ncbi:DUF1667 domain-containing protein [uncultured Clostridium sp.]|jgi:CxxC motif-containing protein|uniref:DUF1667 domain-containing protein n=1 Tax=uncultured Clostridium sp. TaxID=59620 RepID=UPI0026029FC0|nr:DUF1667 domain-containing protein [uncultured Clostridium sp.]
MAKDIFTSVIRLRGSQKHNVVSVKSSKPVDIAIWIEFSKVLGRLYMSVPTVIGDVVCKNILNTGVDIICTRSIPKD